MIYFSTNAYSMYHKLCNSCCFNVCYREFLKSLRCSNWTVLISDRFFGLSPHAASLWTGPWFGFSYSCLIFFNSFCRGAVSRKSNSVERSACATTNSEGGCFWFIVRSQLLKWFQTRAPCVIARYYRSPCAIQPNWIWAWYALIFLMTLLQYWIDSSLRFWSPPFLPMGFMFFIQKW